MPQCSRVFGAAAASAPFTILHGAGSGILTIARGTVPLAMFGPENYGYRLGLLGAPYARHHGRGAIAVRPSHRLVRRRGADFLVGLSIAAFMGLCTLRISKAAS